MIRSPNHGQTCYVKTPAYARPPPPPPPPPGLNLFLKGFVVFSAEILPTPVLKKKNQI